MSTRRKNSFIRNSITSILATVILNPRKQPLYNVLAEFVKAVVKRVPEDGTLVVALAVRQMITVILLLRIMRIHIYEEWMQQTPEQ